MKKGKTLLKVLVILCSMAIALGALAGCSGNDKGGTGGDKTTAAPASQNSNAGEPTAKNYDKKLTFTINAIDPDKAGKDAEGKPDKVFEWLKAKFNFELEWIPCTWEDYYLEKPQLWIAAGEQPDIFVTDIAPARYPLFLNWARNNAFKELPMDLSQYPSITIALEAGSSDEMYIVDGKRYAIPAFKDNIKYGFTYAKGWLYRADWAEAVGLRKPNDEYTWDEWVALTKEVLAKDPGGNGPGKTIGWMGEDWMFPRCIDGIRSISPDLLTYTKKDGKWVWGPQLPESLEAIKELRKLYDEGVIWKDQIIVKNEDLKKYESGLVFARFGIGSSYNHNTMIEVMKGVNPNLVPEKALAYARVKGHDGYFHPEVGMEHWTENAMGPEVSDEKMYRFLDILDYLMSEEGYNMRVYGIPGEDWEMVDGNVSPKWPKNETGVPQAPSGLQWGNCWQWAYRGGTLDLAGLVNPAYPAFQTKRVTELYERNLASDTKPIPFNMELSYFSGEEYAKVGTMEREIYQQIAALMVSKNLEEDWKNWVKAQEPLIQPVLDELNEKLK